MPGYSRCASIGSIVALSFVAAAALTSGASAQTARHTAHHKVHALAPGLAPLAPGVELRASTWTSPGTENRYYSDTVASSHSDLMDMSHRYGQSTAPQYNSAGSLFEF
jgi:uncharacterized membrane protein YjjB (DUF3815 family)